MTEQAETKRDRVRRILITPLLRAGMRKQTRQKADEYADMLVRLADKLAYLDEQHLRGLAAFATRWAKGKARNEWPDEVTLVSRAYELQSPPPRKCDYVVSVMRSKAGELARSHGYHVELFTAARSFGPPFSKLDLSRIANEARRNRAELDRVRGLADRGAVPVERQQWMDWYLRHEAEALAIMDMDLEEDAA
ncbi:hypothetical protein ACN2XU_02675 [Primorskyibacter sp. 2E107]|uniref:hypothetical protein n=1 Tax=Primorskyibacter sp. 2E107 TaxID=3403458 RepID=UPI003AF48245